MNRHGSVGAADLIGYLAQIFSGLDIADGDILRFGMAASERDIRNCEVDVAFLLAGHAESALIAVLTGHIIERAVLYGNGHRSIVLTGRLLDVYNNAGDHAVKGASFDRERAKAVDGNRPAVRRAAALQERAVLYGDNDLAVAGAVIEENFVCVFAIDHVDGHCVVRVSRAPHRSAAVQVVKIDRNVLGQRIIVLNIPFGRTGQLCTVTVNGRAGHIAGMCTIAASGNCRARTAVNHRSLDIGFGGNYALLLLCIIQQFADGGVECTVVIDRGGRRPCSIRNPGQRGFEGDILERRFERFILFFADLGGCVGLHCGFEDRLVGAVGLLFLHLNSLARFLGDGRQFNLIKSVRNCFAIDRHGVCAAQRHIPSLIAVFDIQQRLIIFGEVGFAVLNFNLSLGRRRLLHINVDSLAVSVKCAVIKGHTRRGVIPDSIVVCGCVKRAVLETRSCIAPVGCFAVKNAVFNNSIGNADEAAIVITVGTEFHALEGDGVAAVKAIVAISFAIRVLVQITNRPDGACAAAHEGQGLVGGRVAVGRELALAEGDGIAVICRSDGSNQLFAGGDGGGGRARGYLAIDELVSISKVIRRIGSGERAAGDGDGAVGVIQCASDGTASDGDRCIFAVLF